MDSLDYPGVDKWTSNGVTEMIELDFFFGGDHLLLSIFQLRS